MNKLLNIWALLDDISRNYYTPKYTIWTFEQFDWFTLTILWLHIALIYLLWRIQVAHIAWIYLLWWIRLIRQQFVVNSSSSDRCSSAYFNSSDSLIKLQFEKFTQTVAETALKWLPLSYLGSFVYVFKLHWFSTYFQEVHQLARTNTVKIKSSPGVCYWITGFY